ncbi:MAG: site-specific DNA-methyltransferase [Thermoguttaceae bacterium]|jgi:site-specific DNA-methyltransferase (adenine-specific)
MNDFPYLNQILKCDCVPAMRTLPGEFIPLTVTSPPYDNLRKFGGHTFDFEGIANELFRITRPGGVVAWVVGDAFEDGSETGTSCRQKLYFQQLGFRLYDTIILARRNQRFPRKVRYGPTEVAFILSKGKPRTINLIRDKENRFAGVVKKFTRRRWDGVTEPAGKGQPIRRWGIRSAIWEYTVGSQSAEEPYARKHPALMPEELAEDLIVSWSRPGDLVFDPMAGAATICKMALLRHRRYLGMEIHRPYWAIARRRLRENHERYRSELDTYLSDWKEQNDDSHT